MQEYEDVENRAWMRLQCLRIARTIKPRASLEKMIETSMVIEAYLLADDLTGETFH